jgi:CheY-like chemotaxis protein
MSEQVRGFVRTKTATGQKLYDLVLIDVELPGLDVLGATRRIPAQRDLPVQPRIAMTANASTGYRDCCLAAGMDDYLAKPVTPAQLASAIKRYSPSAVTGKQ